MKIFNTAVYGLEDALRASGYPKRIEFETEEDFKTALERGKKLGNVPIGSGHDCFLKGIIVQADIQYTQYWSMQYQRYHFADIVSSSSKMFRLTKMDPAKCCNKYTLPSSTDQLKKLIDAHERFDSHEPVDGVSSFGSVGKVVALTDGRTEYFVTKGDLFNMVLSNCPMGLELTMRIVTNYTQLKTMYMQRHNTDAVKLPDDWGIFCKFIISLPYFKELCFGNKKTD